MYEGFIALTVVLIALWLLSKISKTEKKISRRPPQKNQQLKKTKSTLFGLAQKHFSECPICTVVNSIELPKEPDTTRYVIGKYDFIEERPCHFCKTTLSAVFDSTGDLSFRDKKWDEAELKYSEKLNMFANKIDDIENKISDIEDDISELENDETDDELTGKLQAAATKKLETLGIKLEKLQEQLEKAEDQQETFDEKWYDKVDRYEERQGNWHDKADDKDML